MSNNEYGNLGSEMKAMKDDRTRLMTETAAEGKKRKARTHQFLAEADKMMMGIRKDVASLKAETGGILADADRFLADAHAGTAELKAETHRLLSEACAMVNQFARTSRKRAADWRGILRAVHGNGHGAPAKSHAATAVTDPPAPKTKAKGNKAQASKR